MLDFIFYLFNVTDEQYQDLTEELDTTLYYFEAISHDQAILKVNSADAATVETLIDACGISYSRV